MNLLKMRPKERKTKPPNKAQRKKIEAAEFDAAIVKRKAKVAATKAKRIAEETAKAIYYMIFIIFFLMLLSMY